MCMNINKRNNKSMLYGRTDFPHHITPNSLLKTGHSQAKILLRNHMLSLKCISYSGKWFKSAFKGDSPCNTLVYDCTFVGTYVFLPPFPASSSAGSTSTSATSIGAPNNKVHLAYPGRKTHIRTTYICICTHTPTLNTAN